MDIVTLMPLIFELILIPCLAGLTVCCVKYINMKADHIRETTDNELIKKYTTLLEQTIITCVVATNQTYVDALKAQGKFDKEAQEIAFKMTKDAIEIILTDEAKMYLNEVYEDLDAYIEKQIEAAVYINKVEISE